MRIRRRSTLLLGAALVLCALVGCYTNCRKWDGPVSDGVYVVATAGGVREADEAMLAAIQDTLTIEVVDGETLLLSYIEPSTRTLVVLEYAIEPF